MVEGKKQRDVSIQNRQLEKAKTKLINLINMRMEGEIEKEDFAEMKAAIEEEIKIISEKLSKANSNDGDNNVQLYDESAVAACLEELAIFSPDKLDKEFADRFVYQIIQLGAVLMSAQQLTNRKFWEVKTKKTTPMRISPQRNRQIVHINQLISVTFFVQSELVDLFQCSLSRKGKNDDFFPVFSFSIPYEKARDFRKRGGQYLRESQYRDLVVDVYL